MSLIVCCYTSTGIAISADSRTTNSRVEQATTPLSNHPSGSLATIRTSLVLSDSTRKLFCVTNRYAVATWGEAFVKDLPIAHYIDEFTRAQQERPSESPIELAESLLAFVSGIAPTRPIGLAVVGYKDGEPYVLHVDNMKSVVTRQNVDSAGYRVYGVYYCGDNDVVKRLLSAPGAVSQVGLFNLQDAVDFTRHLIRTTIDQMRFEPRVATVGGHIDTITLTPIRTEFLVQKALHA
ncbi:MAG: hypothetical protein WD081_06555 [Gammaproteobacteria bacterium]